MKMSLVLFLFLLVSPQLSGAVGETLYTIYLVRHAEKQLDGSGNPALSECGKQRAGEMAKIFGSIKFDSVYSTNYLRTRGTAQPTADEQQLKVKQYDPRKLEEFAFALKERRRDVLVVGHSNTTAVLAGLLTGDKSFATFDESIYDRIYQIVLSDSGGRVHMLHQTFSCSSAKTGLD